MLLRVLWVLLFLDFCTQSSDVEWLYSFQGFFSQSSVSFPRAPDPYPTHTLMDMRTDLTAVPHASLRNPNPEKPGEGA